MNIWPWTKFAAMQKEIDLLADQVKQQKLSLDYTRKCHQEAQKGQQEALESLRAEKDAHDKSKSHLRQMATIMALRAGLTTLLMLWCGSLFGQATQRTIFTTNPPPLLSSVSGPMVSTNSGAPILTYNGAGLSNINDKVFTNDPITGIYPTPKTNALLSGLSTVTAIAWGDTNKHGPLYMWAKTNGGSDGAIQISLGLSPFYGVISNWADSPVMNDSVIIGNPPGMGDTLAANQVVIKQIRDSAIVGHHTASHATNVNNSIFMGWGAGDTAVSSWNESVTLGSGSGPLESPGGAAIGYIEGLTCVGSFSGEGIGQGPINASTNATFVGHLAGSTVVTSNDVVVVGANCDVPTGKAGEMSFGDLIYAAGADFELNSVGTGQVGIGTPVTNVNFKLDVAGIIHGQFYGSGNGLTNIPFVRSIDIPMGAWFTNNCFDGATLTAANSVTPTNSGDTVVFNQGSVTNLARTRFSLPWDWNAGTVKVGLFCFTTITNLASSSDTNVVWSIRAAAVGAGDRLDSLTFGTAVRVTNSVNTLAYAQGLEGITSALTVGNTPTFGKGIIWDVRRESKDSGDTCTNNVSLAQVRVYFTENTRTDFPVSSP